MGKAKDIARDSAGDVLIEDFDVLGSREYDPNYGGPYLDEIQDAQKAALAETLNVVEEPVVEEEPVIEESPTVDELLAEPSPNEEVTP